MLELFTGKPKPLTRLHEQCPLLAILDDRETTVTNEGELVAVFEFSGRDMTGLDPDQERQFHHLRSNWFSRLTTRIVPSHFAMRFRRSADPGEGSFPTRYARYIAETWNARFQETYRTRHFLVLRTARGDVFEQAAGLVAQKEDGDKSGDRRTLRDATNDLAVQLAEFGPKRLAGDELASFWAWLINGEPVRQALPPNGVLDDLFVGVDIAFPAGKRFQIYDGVEERHSAWLTIKWFPSYSSSRAIGDLYGLEREFILQQTYLPIEKNAALREIEDRIKNTLQFREGAETVKENYADVRDQIEADNIRLLQYAMSCQVFADSESELEDAVADVRRCVEYHGFRIQQEKANREALYWAQFPGLEGYNVRARHITSENAGDFTGFQTSGEGRLSCSWGPYPVTMFPEANTGSEYGFTYHNSNERNALGHTLVVGGSNSGKTTLISFLTAQCLRYPGFRQLSFDRLRGMEIMHQMLDGQYVDFGADEVGLNPFQLPDTRENRSFLASWLAGMTDRDDDEGRALIHQAVDINYRLDPRDRRLENLVDAFGLKASGSIRQALEPWLPGGSYGQMFNAPVDALAFDKPLIGFDMTVLLDQLPEVLAPLTRYLMHRALQMAQEDPAPWAIFFDEMRKYLDRPTFGKEVRKVWQEIRKLNGVAIGAVQEPRAILGNEFGQDLVNSTSTFLLFRDSEGTEEEYVDGFGLSRAEFGLVQRLRPRQVLMKRKGAESVVLNVDLSPLGKYLNIFNSSIQDVKRMRELRQRGGKWQREFLADSA